MEEGNVHLAFIVGESAIAEDLQSSLSGQGVTHAAVVTHVRSLRRSLVIGQDDLVVVCIALDEETMATHGAALQRLLADHNCFPTEIRTVGLLSDLGLSRHVASLGCDVYVSDSADAVKAIKLLDREWRAGRASGDPSTEGPERKAAWLVKASWMYGRTRLPRSLDSLFAKGRPGQRRRANQPDDSSMSLPPRQAGRSDQEFDDPKGSP